MQAMAGQTEEPSRNQVRLADLVRPLDTEAFVEQHWLPALPFLSEVNLTLVSMLQEVREFRSVDALLSAIKGRVVLFGPQQFRASVESREAHKFLHQGFNLYVQALEVQLPQAAQITASLAAELGAAHVGVGLEAFAGQAGGLSSIHYDNDTNFQILLQGEKRWEVAENHHIRNPLASYHPERHPDGRVIGFVEEAYADRSPIPTQRPADSVTYEARSGTVMFVPRGWWHEVECVSACFSVNVVIKGMTWAHGLAQALAHSLHGSVVGREYCHGILSDSLRIRSQAHQSFERLRAEAISELRDLTIEEVYLAGRNAAFSWTPGAEGRSLTRTTDGWLLRSTGMPLEGLVVDDALLPIVRRLLDLKGPFRWAQLQVMLTQEIRGTAGATGLWNLLAELCDAGYLKVVQ